ncbi:alanine/glycine:cation symporter family protein [Pontibacillus halophilus]|uniref:alanine/glycine:cation symporter family protein n=1 Tax=Pontibacillus halophilus TaxID=516704 RepID=UPI000415036E|nr:alanine/glycine:cation symporter family protein [Pontibacillus halophilus]
MAGFEEMIGAVSNIIWSYVLIAVLIGIGLFFTIKTKFVQFSYFGEMIRVLFEKDSMKASKKGTAPFQAFTMSVASRVGTGNLAGVASAVALGGPGAVFWMWIIALVGAASGFIESTLAQVYKEPGKDSYRGGPAYYMEKGLKSRKLGVTFAIIITFTYGLVFNAVQSNTIRAAFGESFGTDKFVMAIILAVLTAIVIFGGVRRVASVTGILIPVMAILYLVMAFFALALNITELPSILALIVTNAFGIQEVLGGGFGAAILMGVKRGLFSNEAGMGSAPNAAATAEVTHPVKQGLIQSFAVFTDTILICTATAFIILTSGEPASYMNTDLDGIQITQAAFGTVVGEWANMFIAVAIFLFAFSSVVGNYYYGETNIQFIKDTKLGLTFYRLAVVAMVVFGAMVKVSVVWTMADLAMGVMALINLYAIARLYPVAVAALNDYRKQRKAGKNPVFHKDNIETNHDLEYWDSNQQSQNV